MEVLSLAYTLNPQALEYTLTDSFGVTFLRTVLFHSLSRSIRFISNDHFYLIATKCTGNANILLTLIHFLFDIVQNSARELPHLSRDAFNLLCNLLRYASTYRIPFAKHEALLANEIEWLRQAKVSLIEYNFEQRNTNLPKTACFRLMFCKMGKEVFMMTY